MPRSRYEGEDSGSGGNSCREALRAWPSDLRRAFRVGVSSASLHRWVERRSWSHRAATTGDISTSLACRVAIRSDSRHASRIGVFSSARPPCVAIRSDSRRASRIGVDSSAPARRVAMRSASRRASPRGFDSPVPSVCARRALRAPALSLFRWRRSSRCSEVCAALRAAVHCRGGLSTHFSRRFGFLPPPESRAGSTCLTSCLSVLFRLLRSSYPCTCVSLLPSCFCHVFIRWSRHFRSARHANVISVSAARVGASARGPL